MQRLGIITGLVVAFVGVIWILQGLDVAFAPRSFMTDNRQWVPRGAAAAAAGLLLAGWSSRRGR